jgi:hypothetical protein
MGEIHPFRRKHRSDPWGDSSIRVSEFQSSKSLLRRLTGEWIFLPFIQKRKRMMLNKKEFNLSGVLMVIVLALTGCNIQPGQPSKITTPPTVTPTASIQISTPTPSPVVSPVSTLVFTGREAVSMPEYSFKISQVVLTDSVRMLTAKGMEIYKGKMVRCEEGDVATSKGLCPSNPSGNSVLIIYTELLSGNKQKFMDADLKVVAGGAAESPVAIFTETGGNQIFWIYDVKHEAKVFKFISPDGSASDLRELIHTEQNGAGS